MSRKKIKRGQRCAYCERALHQPSDRTDLRATRDHVLPRVNGGQHKVWSCSACNNLKGSLLPAQWSSFMHANPEWWKLGRVSAQIRLEAHLSQIPN